MPSKKTGLLHSHEARLFSVRDEIVFRRSQPVRRGGTRTWPVLRQTISSTRDQVNLAKRGWYEAQLFPRADVLCTCAHSGTLGGQPSATPAVGQVVLVPVTRMDTAVQAVLEAGASDGEAFLGTGDSLGSGQYGDLAAANNVSSMAVVLLSREAGTRSSLPETGSMGASIESAVGSARCWAGRSHEKPGPNWAVAGEWRRCAPSDAGARARRMTSCSATQARTLVGGRAYLELPRASEKPILSGGPRRGPGPGPGPGTGREDAESGGRERGDGSRRPGIQCRLDSRLEESKVRRVQAAGPGRGGFFTLAFPLTWTVTWIVTRTARSMSTGTFYTDAGLDVGMVGLQLRLHSSPLDVALTSPCHHLRVSFTSASHRRPFRGIPRRQARRSLSLGVEVVSAAGRSCARPARGWRGETAQGREGTAGKDSARSVGWGGEPVSHPSRASVGSTR
ncbi:hypothetical protein JHW43_008739 [Diplocarpon mali]|nr:hypothetical protein JHW43_008739 [Diplocarpon mali]